MSTTKYFVPSASEETKLRAEVHKILDVHRGAKNAIQGKELARMLRQPDDRKVRVVIGHLIEQGIPVASSVSEPAGFFIVNTPDEAAQQIAVLKSRISKLEVHLRDFERAVERMEVPSQQELW